MDTQSLIVSPGDFYDDIIERCQILLERTESVKLDRSSNPYFNDHEQLMLDYQNVVHPTDSYEEQAIYPELIVPLELDDSYEDPSGRIRPFMAKVYVLYRLVSLNSELDGSDIFSRAKSCLAEYAGTLLEDYDLEQYEKWRRNTCQEYFEKKMAIAAANGDKSARAYCDIRQQLEDMKKWNA